MPEYTNAERLVDITIIAYALAVVLVAYAAMLAASWGQRHNEAEAARRGNARALRRASGR